VGGEAWQSEPPEAEPRKTGDVWNVEIEARFRAEHPDSLAEIEQVRIIYHLPQLELED
jgi:hypothetical protein